MRAINKLFITLIFSVLPLVTLAQEKTKLYYDTHVDEILPDAELAFQKGNYNRTIDLCTWHFEIVGNDAANSLLDKAEQCAELLIKMTEYCDLGKREAAKNVAYTLLSLNPDDPAAKQLIEELSKPVITVIPVSSVSLDQTSLTMTVGDTQALSATISPDNATDKTVTWSSNNTMVATVSSNGVVIARTAGHATITVMTNDGVKTASCDIIVKNSQEKRQVDIVPPESVLPGGSNQPVETNNARTRFVLKAGVSVLDIKQFAQSYAPGVSMGFYDIGGSLTGFEVSGYYCPKLMSSGSLFGVDANMVFRIAKGVYPKIGAGYFSFTDQIEYGSTTKGLCAGGGLVFVLGGHFCFELGVKYFPEICAQGVETVTTTPGVSYEFPIINQILPAGIAPHISIGWAF